MEHDKLTTIQPGHYLWILIFSICYISILSHINVKAFCVFCVEVLGFPDLRCQIWWSYFTHCQLLIVKVVGMK